jgi:hypothetical protein
VRYFTLGKIFCREPILWIENARNESPGAAGPHAWLASAYDLEDETEHAANELAEARRLSGTTVIRA